MRTMGTECISGLLRLCRSVLVRTENGMVLHYNQLHFIALPIQFIYMYKQFFLLFLFISHTCICVCVCVFVLHYFFRCSFVCARQFNYNMQCSVRMHGFECIQCTKWLWSWLWWGCRELGCELLLHFIKWLMVLNLELIELDFISVNCWK